MNREEACVYMKTLCKTVRRGSSISRPSSSPAVWFSRFIIDFAVHCGAPSWQGTQRIYEREKKVHSLSSLLLITCRTSEKPIYVIFHFRVPIYCSIWRGESKCDEKVWLIWSVDLVTLRRIFLLQMGQNEKCTKPARLFRHEALWKYRWLSPY